MTDKIRHEILLSVAMSKRIIAMAKARKCSKSDLLADMIETYVNHRSATQADETLHPKLDRILRLATRTNYETILVSFCLSRFIRHQLIYAAALPPPGEQAQAIGAKRYDQFLDTVAKLIARDRVKEDQYVKSDQSQSGVPHASESASQS